MPISLIILTYNSSPHIKKLLDSVFNLLSKEIENEEIEVIVFDNNSTDGTKDIVDSLNIKIKFVRSGKNLGYARGINEAAKKAQGEILVVINPDSELLRFDGTKIIEKFNNQEKLAILGFEIENRERVHEKNAGKFFNPLTFLAYSLGLESLAVLRFSPEKDVKVDFVSGGFVAFRNSFFEKVQGFDEDYFMYIEDMDICYRAKKMGYEVCFSKDAKIVHLGQGSSSREFAITNIYKGLITFYKKNKSGIESYYIKSLLVMKAAIIIFVGTIIGKKTLTTTYLKALKAIS